MADNADGFGKEFRQFLGKGLGLLLAGDFFMLCFFLHGILLKTLNDNALGHESRDLVLEVGLTLIGNRVHFLDAFLT